MAIILTEEAKKKKKRNEYHLCMSFAIVIKLTLFPSSHGEDITPMGIFASLEFSRIQLLTLLRLLFLSLRVSARKHMIPPINHNIRRVATLLPSV